MIGKLIEKSPVFEGVWAVHTTVIRVAEWREAENLVRNRIPERTDIPIFAELLVFQHFYRIYRSGTRFFIKSIKKACSHCSGATCVR